MLTPWEQVHLAYRCAVILRGLISPYLLRRMKKVVATQLPPKTEQVRAVILFVRFLFVPKRLGHLLIPVDLPFSGAGTVLSPLDGTNRGVQGSD